MVKMLLEAGAFVNSLKVHIYHGDLTIPNVDESLLPIHLAAGHKEILDLL